MKKLTLLLLITLAAFSMQASEIALTFTAKHTCAFIPFDSVAVVNLTQGGATVLYYPDSVLTFSTVNINEFNPGKNELYVSQNYPNPFSSKTDVDIYVPERDLFTLTVFDLVGRKVSSFETELENGMHNFTFFAGNEQNYILTVNSKKHFEQKLMIQIGKGDNAKARIAYNGIMNYDMPVSKSGSSDLPFSVGDNLRFLCYVTDVFGNFAYMTIDDVPFASKNYLFDIANNAEQPSAITGSQSVLENQTGLVYSVTEVQGITYNWTVPSGWTITGGQGSNSITVNAGTQSGTLSVTAQNACGTSAASTLALFIMKLPTVTTQAITDITSSNAVSGGNVTSDGNSEVTLRGVVWHTSENPTVGSNLGITSNGTGTGAFISNITGLSPNTTYYVRAYAINSIGTSYGQQLSFTTSIALATVTTNIVANITQTSATAGGNVTSTGGAPGVSRGVVYSTSPNPTLSNSNVGAGSGGIGTFSANITGLTPSITYYVRAYAINDAGVAYGEERSFFTAVVYDIDGNGYYTVIIGNQEWFAENLRVTKYHNGNAIPTGHTDAQWYALTTGAYAVYPHGSIDGLNSEAEVVAAYGRLYNWHTVNDSRGLCPTGWRVPTNNDWTYLERFICNELGNSNCNTTFPLDGTTWAELGINEGKSLKSCRQVNSPLGGQCETAFHPRWNSHDTAFGNNLFGFSSLPAGQRINTGPFANVGIITHFWTSTQNDGIHALHRFFHSTYDKIGRSRYDKKGGFSVRCMRDVTKEEYDENEE
jgi:uncharacterized protein (TIGR02145 family)